MAVTSKRERALQVVLVVLGLGTAGANISALVTSLLRLSPTGGTTAPMFYTILAALGVFLVLAARDPFAYRSLIAYTVWSSIATIYEFLGKYNRWLSDLGADACDFALGNPQTLPLLGFVDARLEKQVLRARA